MHSRPRRILGLSLAVLMTAATVSGCNAPKPAMPTLTAPASTAASVPPQATIPVEKDDPMLHVTKPVEGNTEGVVQIRLYDVRAGWMNGFETENGTFLLADSVTGLLDGLSIRGVDVSKLDLTAFDDAFFANNRLAVIPRNTNSGSVRFGARVEKTADGVNIATVGSMPGVGTADMADWLVLVPLGNVEYSGTVTVENVKKSVTNAQRYARYKF